MAQFIGPGYPNLEQEAPEMSWAVDALSLEVLKAILGGALSNLEGGSVEGVPARGRRLEQDDL